MSVTALLDTGSGGGKARVQTLASPPLAAYSCGRARSMGNRTRLLCATALLAATAPLLAVAHLASTNSGGCDMVCSELAHANDRRHQRALEGLKRTFERMLREKDDELQALRSKCGTTASSHEARNRFRRSLPFTHSTPMSDASRAASRSIESRRRSSDLPWAPRCEDVSGSVLVQAAEDLNIPIPQASLARKSKQRTNAA